MSITPYPPLFTERASVLHGSVLDANQHVAINESVEACDMAKTSLADETLDVAVFSLSLMGLNWPDYINEAHRVLRPGGFIEIAEPASKWENEKLEQLKSAIEKTGFQLVGQPRNSHQFVYLKAVKV